MFKNLLLGIGLFGLAIASAKTYNITLSEPYTVGTTQLKAGDYKLVVNGSTAALEDQQGKVEANGTLENEAEIRRHGGCLGPGIRRRPIEED
jgi:hypothetical protein